MVRKRLEQVRNLLIALLRQGTTARKLAATCALGVVLGIFPVYGSTTLLCFAVAIPLRLNLLLIQAVNYLLTPLQLLLILPFLHTGNWLFGISSLPFGLSELVEMARVDFWIFMRLAGMSVLAGMVVWALLGVLLLPVLFWIFFRMFRALRIAP
jgi:uncharacterized protein (DUF2062 family)